MKNALEMISTNATDYGVALVFHPISDGNTFDVLSRLKQHHLPSIGESSINKQFSTTIKYLQMEDHRWQKGKGA